MVKLVLKISFISILLILFSFQSSISFEAKNQAQPHQVTKTQETSKSLRISPDRGKIPLYFIANEGQVQDKALFYAKASRYNLWLTKEGLVFDSTRGIKKESTKSLRLSPRDINNPKDFNYDRDVTRLVFINANKSPEVIPVDDTEHKVNYFIGKDKSKWRTNIQTSTAVLYRELYPNIDLKVYGIEKQIEYDFVVKPDGQVSNISFEYRDVEKTEIDKDGNLVIETKFGELEHAKPVCYQVIGGERVEVEARFKRIENNTYGFKVKEYNRNYELIIDPLVLVYNTYLGGSLKEISTDIALDSEGAVYVTGYTLSLDFPTLNPLQETTGTIFSDIYITKINASGTAILYSTYLGGDNRDSADDMLLDSEGAIYLTGDTKSVDFPVQNPLQKTFGGGLSDGFIAKINASGTALIFSTFLGGSEWDGSNQIEIDSEGALYVTGYTESPGFPTQNPIQGSYAGVGDGFIAKINASGTAFIYSTFLGGSAKDSCNDLAVDSEGAVYVTGVTSSLDFPTHNPIQGSYAGDGFIWLGPQDGDGFVTKINASGTALVYSTYMGGSLKDIGTDIAVDSEGAAYVTGHTASLDFPTYNPISEREWGVDQETTNDIILFKINSSGTALVYSTYFGGGGSEWGIATVLDSEGAVYLTGNTNSWGMPYGNAGRSEGDDIYVAKISSSGNEIIFVVYVGGLFDDIGKGLAVDSEGVIYITGQTSSSPKEEFPLVNPLQETYGGNVDAFVAKLYFEGVSTVYYLELIATEGGDTDPEPTLPDPLDPEDDYFYHYYSDVVVEILAEPDEGYNFVGWSDDASGSTNPLILAMDSDKTITANFVVQPEQTPGEEGGGCFIATAAYDTPLHPSVKILRDFRDRYLMPGKLGRMLMETYYKYSPFVANFIARHKALKVAVRISLLPLVGFSYSTLHLGPVISAIMLVLIFALPVFVISFFRRRMLKFKF